MRGVAGSQPMSTVISFGDPTSYLTYVDGYDCIADLVMKAADILRSGSGSKRAGDNLQVASKKPVRKPRANQRSPFTGTGMEYLLRSPLIVGQSSAYVWVTVEFFGKFTPKFNSKLNFYSESSQIMYSETKACPFKLNSGYMLTIEISIGEDDNQSRI